MKYIVDRLNETPYNKNFNLISFDSLQSLQLLQILNDVMTEINPQMASDLRDEDPEARGNSDFPKHCMGPSLLISPDYPLMQSYHVRFLYFCSPRLK